MRRIRYLLAPLRSRDFTLVWLGQGISQIGDRCTEIALVWLLVGLTGSSVLMGAVLSAMYIPTLLLLLVGGVIADRGSRRAVILACDGLRALAITVFAVLATLGMISLPTVFVLAAFYGIIAAFFNPALRALYPSLVSPEQYDAANSLQQIVLQVALLGGPALGGYLIAQWNVGVALAVDALTFVIAFLTLLLTRRGAFQLPEQDQKLTQGGNARRHWQEIFAGIRFLKGEVGILSLIVFFSLTNGLNNVEAVLVPRLVREELGLPATAFGLLASAMGVGTLLGALATGLLAGRLRWRAQVICISIMVFGAAIIAMGLAETALLLDVSYLVLGLSFIVPEVVFTSLLQHVIPAEMRGRVFSVLSLIAMAMNPLGLMLAGVLGDSFGTRAGLWIGGGVIVVLSVLVLALPTVRALNRRDVALNLSTPEASGEMTVPTGA